MLYHLLLIHLYRPFLKYSKASTPLPSHVSPRKICTQAASAISKLLRMYKRTYGLKQICNLVVYIAHTVCTIHLLNLPEKNAQRDIIHGVRNLEEMAEGWLCARRTLRILEISANKWQVQLPAEASDVFERTHHKWGSWGSWDQPTSPSACVDSPNTRDNLHNPVTGPDMFPPSGEHAPPVQSSDPIGTNPMPMMGVPMRSQDHPTNPVNAPMASMRTASGFPSVHLRPEFAPEPTYLRPMSLVNYPMPGVAPFGPSASSSNIGAWYHTPGAGMDAPIAAQTSPPVSKASPISGMDGTENLVEESQDWWSPNATTMGLNIEGWSAPWSPEMPNHPSHLPFGNGHLMPIGQHTNPTSAPGTQPQVNREVAWRGSHSP